MTFEYKLRNIYPKNGETEKHSINICIHCVAYLYAAVVLEALTDFHGDEAKMFFFEKKFQNVRLKKTEIFKTANSQQFFTKILDIGPWVSRINQRLLNRLIDSKGIH